MIGEPAGTPLVLVPGLLCDGRLWRHQTEHLADLAEPVVADVTQGASVSEMARSVLGAAPERFALAGLSMGGYVALEIMRIARSASRDSPSSILRPGPTPPSRRGRDET